MVCLQYDERDEVDLCIKYIAQFESTRAQWAAFMTKEIVGVLDNSYSRDDPAVHILAYNMRTKKSVNIVTDLMRKVWLCHLLLYVFHSQFFVGCHRGPWAVGYIDDKRRPFDSCRGRREVLSLHLRQKLPTTRRQPGLPSVCDSEAQRHLLDYRLVLCN